MQGTPVGFTDFVVQLDRNGYLEECVFDFSYSPIRLENGEVGGVLTTVIKTTEKVKAVKALKESEIRFQNLVREANVGIIVLSGEEMHVEVVNEAYGQLIASKPVDLLGKPLFDVIPEAEDIFRPILNQVRLTGETVYLYDQPYGVVVNGKKVEGYLNVVYQAYKETDGTITGVIALCQDVTETIKSQQKIEESEQRFRTFADTIQNLAWIANGDGWINWYNQQWYDYTGTTLEEMEGWGWQKVHHPDHIKNVTEFIKEAWKKDDAWELTFPLRRHDGEYRWFLTRAYPVKDANGNVERWIGTNTDINEQKTNAEEKFLLEFAEDFSHYKTGDEFFGSLVTYIANKTNLDYVFIGKLTEKENNYLTIKTIALANRGRLVPNIEYPLPDGPCEQVLQGTLYNYPNLCRITFPKNQTLVQFNVEGYVGYPLFDHDENAVGLVAVMHEKEIPNPEYVSALLKIVAKRAEFEMERNIITNKLQEKNLELELSNAELKSFSYIASHDLKEPLRKIQAFSKLIIDTETFSDKTQDYFNRIISSGERMQNLIDSLLDFSRTNTTGLIFESCDLNSIVEESKCDLNQTIIEKQATVEYKNLPIINGVRIQLLQLFTNLIENAVKYSRPEIKPYIRITSSYIHGNEIAGHAINQQHGYHAIKIADNGIGFDMQYSTKIFELFQRLHGKNEYSGTGIGLAIVKKIVTNHYGFIITEGIPNIGSTFTIYLPKV
ncbi:MAG: PAS domain-containing protein, partial [Chitinophagaceae bacterium]